MQSAHLDQSLTMYYEDHYFGEPWREPEVALLIHGMADSSVVWFGWVPHLVGKFRVVRPDLRGFGKSTIPAPGFEWSPAAFAADLVRFLDALKIDVVHVVGARLGGSIAFQFAADYPERTRTLAIVGGLVKGKGAGGSMNLLSVSTRIREAGLRVWAAETQRARLGSEASEEQVAWWTDMMAQSDPQVCVDVTATVPHIDVSGILSRIKAPTLIITTDGGGLQSVETVREAQQRIPNSELVIIPSDASHVAATRPDECARHVLDFIAKQHATR
jgi:pimeloyl-ACP methyl ester carboxylesterase